MNLGRSLGHLLAHALSLRRSLDVILSQERAGFDGR
jgi:hypothetical protein